MTIGLVEEGRTAAQVVQPQPGGQQARFFGGDDGDDRERLGEGQFFEPFDDARDPFVLGWRIGDERHLLQIVDEKDAGALVDRPQGRDVLGERGEIGVGARAAQQQQALGVVPEPRPRCGRGSAWTRWHRPDRRRRCAPTGPRRSRRRRPPSSSSSLRVQALQREQAGEEETLVVFVADVEDARAGAAMLRAICKVMVVLPSPCAPPTSRNSPGFRPPAIVAVERGEAGGVARRRRISPSRRARSRSPSTALSGCGWRAARRHSGGGRHLGLSSSRVSMGGLRCTSVMPQTIPGSRRRSCDGSRRIRDRLR